MAEVAAGFAVVLLVNSQNLGVLVALADGFASILAVDGFHTFADDVAVAVVIGLASTTDATAGACHDFDEVVAVGVALAYLFHHLACVAETVADGDLHGQAVEVDSSGTNAVAIDAAALLEVDLREGAALVPTLMQARSFFDLSAISR